MKKIKIIILLFSILIGCVSKTNAQKESSCDSTYYYYKGEQLYIPLNKRYIVVYYNDTVILSLDEIIGKASIEEDEIVYSDSIINTHRLLVDLEEQDYSTSLIALKNNLNKTLNLSWA